MKKLDNLKRIKTFVFQNKLLVFLASALLLGIFVGSNVEEFMKNQTVDSISNLFLDNFKSRTSQPAFYAITSTISSVFLYILISIFMAFSVWGFIFIPLIPFFRGLSIGLIQNYLYSQYGLKGVLFQLIVLFPGLFISSVAILLMAKESMLISQAFSNLLIFKSSSNFEKNAKLKDYIIKIGIILSMALLSVVVDISLNFLFLKLFYF